MKKIKLFIVLVTLFGLGLNSVKAQTADLMDVRFQAGSIAKNVAPAGTLTTPLVVTTPSLLPATVFEPSINQFVSRFSGSGSSTSGPIYKLPYDGNNDFKTALNGSFTIEAYVKTNVNEDRCPVSAQESGGFGIEHKGNSTNNTQLWYNYDNNGRKTATVGNQSIYSATPQYYHVVYVVDRNGNDFTITAYYNGVANGTFSGTGTYYQPSNADARWVAIGGDAHPTYTSQYWWNGDVAFARMYSGSLNQTQVTTLYNQTETRKTLTKVSNLNTVISTKLPGFIMFSEDVSKKALAKSLLTQGWELMGNMTTTDSQIQTYLDNVTAQLGNIDPVVSALPSIAIVSDTHVGNDKGWLGKLNKMIDQMIASSPKLDAVFINGDVTDWGTQAQYTDAKNLFARLEAVVPVYYLMGNHDWFTAGANNFFTNTLGQSVNQYVVIKGYPFITISMERSTYPDAYTQPSQDFLVAKIAQARLDCPGKPIIVFSHMPVTGTVYGSYTIGGGDSWGTSGLKAICEANPDVILFSGHSHYPISDERSIHQDKFTSINEGSMTYSEIETGLSEGIHPEGYVNVTEGCFLLVQDNGDVKIKRWDYYRGEEIKTPWLIKAPFTTESFTYKNRTGGAAPYFELIDKPTVSAITDNSCTVTFPQGKDDDLVHHYLVEVLDKNGVVLANPKYTVFSGFFLGTAMPSIKSWNIIGLNEVTQYKVRVTAIDSYGNVSVPPIESDQFSTTAYVVNPSAVLATPNLLDVKFKPSSTAIDVSAKAFTITKGSTNPNTAYDSTIKQYVQNSVGTSTQYFKIDYQSDASFKSTLQTAFTLETYTKFESSTSALAPVSAQEGGGFGYEQAKNSGNLEFWFRNTSGGYVQVNFGKPTVGEYYHLVTTWDNATKKLTAFRNGVQVDQKTLGASENLVFPSNVNAQWIGIGGDASTGTTVQSAFKGVVSTTRMYNKALNRDETILANQQILNRQALTKVDDLNTALTTIIPNSNKLTETQKINLLNEGWNLMNDLNSTDAQMTTFLNSLLEVLPVKFGSFQAKLENHQGVKLTWNTLTENNANHFELFASTDGKNFHQIGTVKAVGNSNTSQVYQFVDKKASVGLNYYQLKQVDNNGNSFAFDKIATANVFSNKTQMTVSAMNNDNLLVSVYSPSMAHGRLLAHTIAGQKLGEVAVVMTSGNNRYQLPVGSYKGLIIVTLTTNQLKISKKAIK